VAEAVVAWEIARAMCEKFPSDSIDDMVENVNQYKAYTEKF